MKKDEKKVIEELYNRYLRETPDDVQEKDLASKEDFKYPDAKKHQLVSFIKSGIRIFGYMLLPFHLGTAAVVLIISEVVGIAEELV